MEKSNLRNTKYTGISANEALLLSMVEKGNLVLFGVKEVGVLTGWGRSRVQNTLGSLAGKDLLTRVRRDSYVLTREMGGNVLRIATELVKPSYVSFWTALSLYGFTEQQVRSLQLVATKQVPPFSLAGFGRVEVVKFRPYRFFGYQRRGEAVIAEPEKALVDSLFRLDLCGGMGEFTKCLRNAWPGLNRKRLIDYAVRFRNKSAVSRLGHIVESLGLEDSLDRLLKERSESFVRLDPHSARTSKYDRKWRVAVNREIRPEEIR